jgi:hypothetical protein
MGETKFFSNQANEELTRSPNEGSAALVLGSPRGFAHDHEARVERSRPNHHALPGVVEGALRARGELVGHD